MKQIVAFRRHTNAYEAAPRKSIGPHITVEPPARRQL